MSGLDAVGQVAIEAGLRAGPARLLQFVCKFAVGGDKPGGNVIWASMSYFAEKLGVSNRTAFRHSAKLRDKGLWYRQPGDRHNVPNDADKPAKLTSHGYAITNPAPYLLQLARHTAAGWIKKREEKKARKLERQREKRQQREQDRKEWRAQHPYPAKPERTPSPSHRPFPAAKPPERVEAVPPEAFEAIGSKPSTAPK